MLFFLTLTLGQGVNKKWVMTMKIKEVEQKTKLSAKAITTPDKDVNVYVPSSLTVTSKISASVTFEKSSAV